MTGPPGSERPVPDFWPRHNGSPADDVLEAGRPPLSIRRWRPPLIAVILMVAGLLTGLVAGYAAGDRHASNVSGRHVRSSSAGSSRSAVATPAALSQSGGQCSAQVGHALQLGIQVTNQSATAVALQQIRAVLPMGGLSPIAQTLGPCGELPAPSLALGNALPPGASTWITVTFRVLVGCPSALPVQFVLGYDQLGRATTVRLPGFDDLGRVHYANCPIG